MRLTSVGIIGLEGNITSKDVTHAFKMAVIRTFFNLDTEEIMEEQGSEHITTIQVTHFHSRFRGILKQKPMSEMF